MKQQEIFDAAAIHLMGMDGPSLDADGDACVYRGGDGGDGQMCAVGVFIKDEHYDCDLEGQSISACGNQSGQAVADAVAASWGQDDLTEDQLMLLADLQNAHDHITVDRIWSKAIAVSLDSIANKYHLRFDPKDASA